MLTQSSNNC
jgi:hypothetical protein